MTKDEALKMALEALEADELDMVDDGSGNMVFRKEQALAAIKEALAHPEQEPVAWMFQHDETGRMNYVSNDGIHDPTMFLGMNPRYALVCPLYTTPHTKVACAEKFVGEAATKLQQKQETIEGLNRDYDLLFAEHQLLLKKEWVGLSDEERQDIALEVPIDAVFITEAVLKDKNTREEE